MESVSLAANGIGVYALHPHRCSTYILIITIYKGIVLCIQVTNQTCLDNFLTGIYLVFNTCECMERNILILNRFEKRRITHIVDCAQKDSVNGKRRIEHGFDGSSKRTARLHHLRQVNPIASALNLILYLTCQTCGAFVVTLDFQDMEQAQVVPQFRVLRSDLIVGVRLQTDITHTDKPRECYGCTGRDDAILPAPAHTAVVRTVFNHPIIIT